MVFQSLVKFVLICFDSLAWPLFALCYPLRASIRAIEANSIIETKKLVTYWIIFSLISLFEHAFMGILQWLPFWPYMKLTIVCWTTIPRFDGALYLYDHLLHPCVCMDLQTMSNWFNKQQQDFSLKINFLAEADDELVKAHGPTEASEKLEADPKEGTEPSILHKDIKPVQVTEKRDVAPVNPILEADPDAVRTVNKAITLPGTEGEVGFDLPSDKQVQKEWTCAMCQVTTTSEKTLNSHLRGRRHMNACERLMKAKNQPSKPKLGLAASVVKDMEPPKHGSTTGDIQGTQKKQKPPKPQVSASSVAPNNSGFPTDNSSAYNEETNPKTETCETNQPKEESKKLLPTTNMAGNQLISSENVQGQQQVGKEHSETKIPQFRCTICNISCCSSEDLNCHLRGRKHLFKIQNLNSLRKNELA